MRSYTNVVDKSDWERGPWDDEPDKVQWIDESTNLDCLAVRNERYGCWCGYVGIDREHPFYGKYYDEIHDVDVHGGLTFSDQCLEGPEESSICHVPEPGRTDDIWWLGFDCGHHMDLSPAMEAIEREFKLKLTGRKLVDDVYRELVDGIYRELDYVQAECRQLAQQIGERSGTPKT